MVEGAPLEGVQWTQEGAAEYVVRGAPPPERVVGTGGAGAANWLSASAAIAVCCCGKLKSRVPSMLSSCFMT